MPRATGPIGYIEHRSPRKDENGKYIIHPQFVQKEMYDAEKMAHDSQGRCMANGAQFVLVMDAIESLTLQALGRGDAVRIGDICTIRPKLRVRPLPLWSYIVIPYRRTSTSPYVVHPYL